MADNSKRLEKADKLLQKGKADAALDEYLAILEDEPKNDKVRQTAADLCLAVGRNREGSALLSRLFEQEIDSGEVHKGIVTYKKLAKISKPTPLQTFHYGQLVEKKDKKEALEAYQTALEGFEAQRKDKQAVAAAKAIVDLAPTPKNLQRAAEKCAFLGESAAGALFFLQLGLIKEQDAPGSGFEWFEKAYGLDPANLQAVLLYARGLFAHNALTDCIAVLEPAASGPISTLELRELYARSLMAAKRPAEAEPFAWELFEKDPNQLADIVSLVGAYLDIGQAQRALDL
ncbi:MAG TPA: tetratricopeptide repeat protein, partial [Alphaproteobacteria bacterium]|nr:tetratricopeptide repeat protein [Alphaproteobacteria bacterium]